MTQTRSWPTLQDLTAAQRQALAALSVPGDRGYLTRA